MNNDLNKRWEEAEEDDKELIFSDKGRMKTLIKPNECKAPVPHTQKIRECAVEKAKTYARLVGEVFGTTYECYGFLLVKPDEGIVEDVILAPDQEVTVASVDLNIESVQRAGEIVEDLQFIVGGWWHSHGSMRAFHSGTDDYNIETVLNQTAAYQTIDEQKVKYAYSLVVSTREEKPYSEVAVLQHCGTAVTRTVPLEVLDGGLVFNIDEMKEEVKRELKKPVFKPYSWDKKRDKDTYYDIYYPRRKRKKSWWPWEKLDWGLFKPDEDSAWEKEVHELLSEGMSLTEAIEIAGLPPKKKEKKENDT